MQVKILHHTKGHAIRMPVCPCLRLPLLRLQMTIDPAADQ